MLNILYDLQGSIKDVNEEDIENGCLVSTNAQEHDNNSNLFEDLIKETRN